MFPDNASLILIPTPLCDEEPLHQTSTDWLQFAADNPDNCLILVEEHKIARRKWLSWGLPREAIENFRLYNEHTSKDDLSEIFQELLQGKKAFLFSDGGLPAFLDPGRLLVLKCHENGLRVTCAPFENSVVLATALSGMPMDSFWFEGFLPREKDQRKARLKNLMNQGHGSVLMDTPYRLKTLIKEIKEVANSGSGRKNHFFLAMDLGRENEELLHFSTKSIKNLPDLGKREFVLLIAPDSFQLN